MIGGLRRHWAFVTLAVVSAALRGVVFAAYRPDLFFWRDSWTYLTAARTLVPPVDRPAGYALLLRVVALVASARAVPLLQHVLAVAVAVLLYALLLHRRVRPLVAAAACVPLLLDAYQLNIEQFVLSETLFEALLAGGIVLLLWCARPPVWAAAGAGLLLGLAGITRSVGIPVAVVVAVWLATRRVGLVRPAAFAGLVAAPVAGYALWFAAVHGGPPALAQASGRMLYGKVEPFADCSRLHLTPVQARLCVPEPPAGRRGSDYYTWNPHSPVARLGLPGAAANQVAQSYAEAVIVAQPGAYARAVLTDLGRYAWWPRRPWPNAQKLSAWTFFDRLDFHRRRYLTVVGPLDFAHRPVPTSIDRTLADVLAGYQRVGYTPGTVLVACALLGLAGVVSVRGRRRLPRLVWSRRRADAALLAIIGITLVTVPAATVAFDYRFLLPELVVLPLAAAFTVSRRAAQADHAAPVVSAIPLGPPTPWWCSHNDQYRRPQSAGTGPDQRHSAGDRHAVAAANGHETARLVAPR